MVLGGSWWFVVVISVFLVVFGVFLWFLVILGNFLVVLGGSW